jgi:hypothetical protein
MPYIVTKNDDWVVTFEARSTLDRLDEKVCQDPTSLFEGDETAFTKTVSIDSARVGVLVREVGRLNRAQEIEPSLLHQAFSVVTEISSARYFQDVLPTEHSNTDLSRLIGVGAPVFAIQADHDDVV